MDRWPRLKKERGRHIVLAEKEHADNAHALGGIHRPEKPVGIHSGNDNFPELWCTCGRADAEDRSMSHDAVVIIAN